MFSLRAILILSYYLSSDCQGLILYVKRVTLVVVTVGPGLPVSLGCSVIGSQPFCVRVFAVPWQK